MKPIVEILDAAEREVLAHTIGSTRGLRAFFCQHGGEQLMSSLQEEAVRRGLYRYMGQRYAEAVKGLLRRTRQCLAFGRFRTEDELRLYLVDLAGSLVRYRDLALAINDLLIHARQTGLYSFLRVPPPRTSLTTGVHMTVTLLCKTGSAVELKLDAEALHVLSAAVEFTSRLNPRCRELAQAFEPLFRNAVPPQDQAEGRLRLSAD